MSARKTKSMVGRTHLSPREVCDRLGVSEPPVRDALNSGALVAVKLGARTLIPAAAVSIAVQMRSR